MRFLLARLLLAVPTYVLIAAAVVVVAAFRPRATPRLRRWRFVIAAGFAVAYLACTPAFSNALVLQLERQYEPRPVVSADRSPDNLIIVLTGGWFRKDGTRVEIKISEDGWERLDAGVKLWQQIDGTMLIAGAPAPDGSGSVAGAMAEAAKARGVPASALIVEPNSLDTHENLAFSLPTLQAHADHLWLVTTASHMPRAMAVAKKLGLRPIPYPCFYKASVGNHLDRFLPDNSGPSLFEIAMHEKLGLWFYKFKGWA
jgi:uncharacterized SAM-binding protein YcdF (DUF218 family)